MLRNVLGIPVWTIGFILADRTPSPMLFRSTLVTTTVGWLLIGIGGVLIVIALVTIRSRAVMPSVRDALVHNGIYAHVRHPIHTGVLFEMIGLILVAPTLTVALAIALGVVWILVQTRLQEIDLLQRLPTYRDYMNTIPRFSPHFKSRP
jgi:protein-S-isoprenylcysteine O-methyltransferase Ste14